MDKPDSATVRLGFCHRIIELAAIMETYAALSKDETTEKSAGILITLACCIQEKDQNDNKELFDSLVTFCDELCDKGLISHGVNPNDVQ